MKNPEQLSLLRQEYLALSKRIYLCLQAGQDPAELARLQQLLNTTLARIKQLEDDNPSDLIKE